MDNATVKEKFAGGYKYGFHDEEKLVFKSPKGLTEQVVRQISEMKNEPEWMLARRLDGLKAFVNKSLPTWGPDLSTIDFDGMNYYNKPSEGQYKNWEDVPENMKKTFEKLGIPEAEKKFLAGVSSQYDCLASDSLVPTSRGIKRISNITTEEKVFALNEKTKRLEEKKVLAVLNKGIRGIFEVKVSGGRVIRATFNHPFLALVDKRKEGRIRRRYAKEWKYLRQLSAGDLIAVAKKLPVSGKSQKLNHPTMDSTVVITNQFGTSRKHDYSYMYKKTRFPEKSSEDLLWLFGLFVGDGWIDKNGSKVTFAIPDSEPSLRNELGKVTQRLFGVNAKDEDNYRVSIHSSAVANFFSINGFDGHARTKLVPNWVYSLPENQILAFIGGYADSDGGVRDHPKNHDIIITSVNPGLLESVRNLAYYCGLRGSVVMTVHQQSAFNRFVQQTFYRLVLSGELGRVGIRDSIKSSRIRLKKYHHSSSSANGTCFRTHTSEHLGFARIESIKYVGLERVFDISVEGHHNFVAEGIVVHNSEVIYHSLQKELTEKGVVFLDMDSGLREYEDIVRKYFGTVVPANDNKFAGLNTACWSGGSFVYVPSGVSVDIPLQAYFRINAKNSGQFERTLIIAEPGSFIHYVEGCSAPIYSTESLHAAVVEIIALAGSRVRYTTIQNWSNDVYNLVTKRSKAYRDSTVEWVDGNIGSRITQKYPCIMLMEPGARGEVISVAFAGKGQVQDAGAKIYHLAPNTSSSIVSKSVSMDGGKTTYRGLVSVLPTATNVKSNVECDALILDEKSASDTVPYMSIGNDDVSISHEASVSKLDEEKLFYLQSRGFSAQAAKQLLVQGFIEPFTKNLPMEYAVELNRLVELEMEGSVG